MRAGAATVRRARAAANSFACVASFEPGGPGRDIGAMAAAWFARESRATPSGSIGAWARDLRRLPRRHDGPRPGGLDGGALTDGATDRPRPAPWPTSISPAGSERSTRTPTAPDAGPRVRVELRARGVRVAKKRAARLMRGGLNASSIIRSGGPDTALGPSARGAERPACAPPCTRPGPPRARALRLSEAATPRAAPLGLDTAGGSSAARGRRPAPRRSLPRRHGPRRRPAGGPEPARRPADPGLGGPDRLPRNLRAAMA